MRGGSAFSLHNWKMLSKCSPFCFFFPLGGTDLTGKYATRNKITSPYLLLQTESLRSSHWASVSYLSGIIFCIRTLLRGGNGEQSDKIKKLDSEMPGLPMSLITSDNKAMLFFLLVSSNAKINSVIHIITD